MDEPSGAQLAELVFFWSAAELDKDGRLPFADVLAKSYMARQYVEAYGNPTWVRKDLGKDGARWLFRIRWHEKVT